MDEFKCSGSCNVSRPFGIIHKGHWAVTIFRYGYAEAWEAEKCCWLGPSEYIHYLFGPNQQAALAFANVYNRRN